MSDAAWAITYISKEEIHVPLLLQTLPDSSLAYVLPSSPGAAVASAADDDHAATTSALLSSASSSSASPATPRQVAAALMDIARGLDLVPIGAASPRSGGGDGSGGGGDGSAGGGEAEGGGEPIGLTDGWQLTIGFDHQGATGAMGSGELWRDDVLDAAKIFSGEEGLAEVEGRVGIVAPAQLLRTCTWRSPLGPRARFASLRALECPSLLPQGRSSCGGRAAPADMSRMRGLLATIDCHDAGRGGGGGGGGARRGGGVRLADGELARAGGHAPPLRLFGCSYPSM